MPRSGYVSMTLNRIVILIVFFLVGSCGGDGDVESPPNLPINSLPGVYVGVFPCEGCPGIPTTLWLRSDGRFFFEQEYPAVEEREAMSAHNLGRWNWVVDERTLTLQGSGPARRFARQDADTLMMRTDSDLEHRLGRDASAPDFSATIRMVGMARMRGGNAWFTECLTGLEAPVKKDGDFARFRHQYRSAGGQGRAVVVELEGHFSWSPGGAPGSLTIDRFVTVKAEGGC